MADVEVVIRIPEEMYKWVNEVNKFSDEYGISDFIDLVKNGTPLPKGHGRIGDLDKIKKEMQNYHDDCAKTSEYTRLGFETAIAVVEDAKAIIETDKENEDETSNKV